MNWIPGMNSRNTFLLCDIMVYKYNLQTKIEKLELQISTIFHHIRYKTSYYMLYNINPLEMQCNTICVTANGPFNQQMPFVSH